jgi:hypothetical protein
MIVSHQNAKCIHTSPTLKGNLSGQIRCGLCRIAHIYWLGRKGLEEDPCQCFHDLLSQTNLFAVSPRVFLDGLVKPPLRDHWPRVGLKRAWTGADHHCQIMLAGLGHCTWGPTLHSRTGAGSGCQQFVKASLIADTQETAKTTRTGDLSLSQGGLSYPSPQNWNYDMGQFVGARVSVGPIRSF